MKTDSMLKADIMERLDAIPALNACDIEITVDNGMVTLSGDVDTPQTRFQVERSARRVSGMRGLAIDVRPAQPAARRRGKF